MQDRRKSQQIREVLTTAENRTNSGGYFLLSREICLLMYYIAPIRKLKENFEETCSKSLHTEPA